MSSRRDVSMRRGGASAAASAIEQRQLCVLSSQESEPHSSRFNTSLRSCHHALLTLPRHQAVIGCCSHDQPTTDRPNSPKITHPLELPTPRNDILHSTTKEAKEAHAKVNMFEYRYFPSIFDSLSMFTYLHVEIHRSTNRTPLTKNSPIFDPIDTFDRTSLPQFTKFSNPQNTRKK
jgi:hypothetical protein